MAQSLKQIKNRIRSVENTKKVTGAMQMISVVKLHRIEDELLALRPYALRLENLMHHLAGLNPDYLREYFKEKSAAADILLYVLTSDSGLCGMYNQNIIRKVEDFLRENKSRKVKLILVGQKGLSYFRSKTLKIANAYIGLNAKLTVGFCDKVVAEFSELFLTGKVSAVYIAYTYFENAIIQRAVIEPLLSIKPKVIKRREYFTEPDLKSILTDIIPQYLKIKTRLVFLEAFTSEHAARTVSMKTATDNAKELLELLVLLRNKVRQAGITQDILEITSSVEALRGS